MILDKNTKVKVEVLVHLSAGFKLYKPGDVFECLVCELPPDIFTEVDAEAPTVKCTVCENQPIIKKKEEVEEVEEEPKEEEPEVEEEKKKSTKKTVKKIKRIKKSDK